MSNARHLRGSAWLNFPVLTCERWHNGKLVLIGDAAHSAHFSVGSGTKLAFEDAIALARLVHDHGTSARALDAFQADRGLEVIKLQNAARNSTEWFEHVTRYVGLEPIQFAYSLLTRSQRISHENLRLRDRTWLEGSKRGSCGRLESRRQSTGRPCSLRFAFAGLHSQSGGRLADVDVFRR